MSQWGGTNNNADGNLCTSCHRTVSADDYPICPREHTDGEILRGIGTHRWTDGKAIAPGLAKQQSAREYEYAGESLNDYKIPGKVRDREAEKQAVLVIFDKIQERRVKYQPVDWSADSLPSAPAHLKV